MPPNDGASRRAQLHVNLAAVERNVAALAARAAPADLCAVVKADGYGHGAVPVARAALGAGAGALAVATAEEALGLRRGGIPGRVVVLGPLFEHDLRVAIEAEAEVVVWTAAFLRQLRGMGRSVATHVKLDTGLGRFGTREAGEARRLAVELAADPDLELVGLMTHLATAEEPDSEFVGEQLAAFLEWGEPLRRDLPGHPRLHAANSAATLAWPESHLDMVRCGIGLYGVDQVGAGEPALAPAAELTSVVATVKPCASGQSVGYGRRFVASRPTLLATVPIGYGDGWPRLLSDNSEVLIGGRRRPVRGAISMDSLVAEVDDSVRVGDEVVLLGSQGTEEISVEEIAARSQTIAYELLTGLSPRVVRAPHRDGRRPDGDGAALSALPSAGSRRPGR